MPLTPPVLQGRSTYAQLRADALSRGPIHTPEWTNFNESDPGVTLVDMFAFLTESLIYRANLIPERNRFTFLNLLGLPLQPGASARGLVTISNANGPLQTLTLNHDLEVRAGQVPFRTELGLDVLPIEMQIYLKRTAPEPSPSVREQYRLLYLSYLGGQTTDAGAPLLYETVPFPPPSEGDESGVSFGDTVDGAVWIALLLRAVDRPYDETQRELARRAIANRTLNLGILPILPNTNGRRLEPLGKAGAGAGALLSFELPDLPPGGALPLVPVERVPRYAALPTQTAQDVLGGPGIVQISLPAADRLGLWTNVDPLEMGVGDFPPSLEDTSLSDRLITWLRIRSPASVEARLLWVGGNATTITQRARIANELLPSGSGQPDQVVTLSQTPVVPDSVHLSVTPVGAPTQAWEPIPDLYMAGPEIVVPDPAAAPGTPPPPPRPVRVYVLDPEAGQLRFGDGTHGARPPAGATLRATYDRGLGAAGNVAAGAINQAPALPAGLVVTNPVRTWGGVEPETVAQGEKQVTRMLQHQDRLVTAADFETITYRTPGIHVGRVEVLPAYNPEIGSSAPGDAPGAVTLLVIPQYDAAHPNAPMPDRMFLDAICEYLDARRLVTTEVLLRAPNYRSVWVSIGVEVAPRASVAEVTDALKTALGQFLSPLPPPGTVLPLDDPALFVSVPPLDPRKGWPLRKAVSKLEIAAVANRVPGVVLVNDVTLIDDTRVARDTIAMFGLDLPTLAGVAVGLGAPPPTDALPGFGPPAAGPPAPPVLPVPFIPTECR